MQLTNRYIFLPNPHFKDENILDDTNYKSLHRSIRRYLKSTFKIDGSGRWKIDFIKSEISDTQIIEENSFDLRIVLNEMDRISYVDVYISGNMKKQIIDFLESSHKKLLSGDNIKNNRFLMIVSYDSISEYYCNKLYPKLSKLARKYIIKKTKYKV